MIFFLGPRGQRSEGSRSKITLIKVKGHMVEGYQAMESYITDFYCNNVLALHACPRPSLKVSSLIAYDNGADRITERGQRTNSLGRRGFDRITNRLTQICPK